MSSVETDVSGKLIPALQQRSSEWLEKRDTNQTEVWEC